MLFIIMVCLTVGSAGSVFVAITTGAMNAMFISCYYIKSVNSRWFA
jgi:hypothetical protein